MTRLETRQQNIHTASLRSEFTSSGGSTSVKDVSSPQETRGKNSTNSTEAAKWPNLSLKFKMFTVAQQPMNMYPCEDKSIIQLLQEAYTCQMYQTYQHLSRKVRPMELVWKAELSACEDLCMHHCTQLALCHCCKSNRGSKNRRLPPTLAISVRSWTNQRQDYNDDLKLQKQRKQWNTIEDQIKDLNQFPQWLQISNSGCPFWTVIIHSNCIILSTTFETLSCTLCKTTFKKRL